jgi:Fic family protein
MAAGVCLLLVITIVNVSERRTKPRAAYYAYGVQTKGDGRHGSTFFLTGLRDTAEQAAAAARRIVKVFDDHLEALGRPAASVRVFEHMQRNPIVSIPATAERIGISAPTVAKSLEHMHDLGMFREIGQTAPQAVCIRSLSCDLERRHRAHPLTPTVGTGL